MKTTSPWRGTAVCLTAVLALSPIARAEDPANASDKPARKATWEEQLREMVTLLYRTSGINVINGLNLTPEQASKLRAMAVEVRKASSKDVDPAAEFRSDLAEVRTTYRDIQKTLLSGEEVTPALRDRVMKARALESLAIRSQLGWNPSAEKGSCARCHTAPDANAPPPRADEAFDQEPPQAALEAKEERARAHFMAAIGTGGLAKVVALAGDVDGLLNDAQKAMLQDFSCCLIPPSGLSDPVRIGQADVSEEAMKILDQARAIPAASWPAKKEWLLDRAEQIAVLRNPSATDADKKAVRDRVAAVYEKARSLSDVDYELEKKNLSAELKASPAPAPKGPLAKLQASFFLLGSGTVDAYDALAARRAADPKAGSAPPAGSTPPPAEGST